MCGIAVLHALSTDPDPGAGPVTGTGTPPPPPAEMAALGAVMLARLEHRGPDGTGSRTVGRSWLGHTRLSIVDLPSGEQPMGDADGRRWVVCNGEIYNHLQLRELLPGPWRTRSDSEAALHASADGPSGVAQLRGMFAFCVAGDEGDFLAARDRLGVKPLYWARRHGLVAFASELRAFEPDWRPVVEEFPPGHLWTPAGGLVRYGEIVAETRELTDRPQAQDAIRDALVTAVRRRMMADVGVGVFLSGGLDSSLVAVMARAAGPSQRIHSFAAGTEDSSDLAAARVVADHLGLDHHERVYSADEVVDVLPTVVASIESFEPSLVRSAVPNYLLADLAARHVKVVLTGEGADELFAGYDHLRDITDADELRLELIRSVEGLHNLNLQRCDRVTMAHGLEARVPFLDLDLIAVAQRVPIAWKLPGEAGQEKAILRESFEGWLPPEILWRRKEQFGDGSGTAAVMAERAGDLAPEGWADERSPGCRRHAAGRSWATSGCSPPACRASGPSRCSAASPPPEGRTDVVPLAAAQVPVAVDTEAGCSARAVDRHREGGAHLVHAIAAQLAEPVDQHGEGHTLDRVEVDCRTTRYRVVTGLEHHLADESSSRRCAWCDQNSAVRGITASRERTTTGRRTISGISHHQTSPRAGKAFTMRPRPA